MGERVQRLQGTKQTKSCRRGAGEQVVGGGEGGRAVRRLRSPGLGAWTLSLCSLSLSLFLSLSVSLSLSLSLSPLSLFLSSLFLSPTLPPSLRPSVPPSLSYTLSPRLNGGPPADLLINQGVRDNVSGHTTRAPPGRIKIIYLNCRLVRKCSFTTLIH